MTREEIPSKMNLVRKCSGTYRLLVLAFSNNVFQRLMREMSEEEILANGSMDFATGLVSTARLKTEDVRLLLLLDYCLPLLLLLLLLLQKPSLMTPDQAETIIAVSFLLAAS
jgi:hypothetical protein